MQIQPPDSDFPNQAFTEKKKKRKQIREGPSKGKRRDTYLYLLSVRGFFEGSGCNLPNSYLNSLELLSV